MRKIEEQMLSAIEAGKYWTSGNTFVNPCVGFTEVHLHGNHIANVDSSYGTVEVNKKTLKNYPTRTTMSRLKALGVDVCQRNNQVVLDGEILK